jgi:hypothetical protein
MKCLLPILVLASSLLLGGCATPLTVAKDSGRFAEALSIAPNDVLILSYCSFGKSPKGPKPKFMRNEGVVVATPDLLHMSPEQIQAKTEPQPVSLKYSEIQTVAHKTQGFGCQIQIESNDSVLVLNITPNKARWDCDVSKALLYLITSKGVRVVEAQKWYDFEGGGGMAPIYIGPLF